MDDIQDTRHGLVCDKMTDEDWQEISARLGQYNITKSKGLSREPGEHFGYILKDDEKVIGGIACRAFYKSLHIDHLWIDDDYRGRGHGKELIIRAEETAMALGCISSQTSSYSFQAPRFYEKMGYEMVGAFAGYPDGVKKFYFGKILLR